MFDDFSSIQVFKYSNRKSSLNSLGISFRDHKEVPQGIHSKNLSGIRKFSLGIPFRKSLRNCLSIPFIHCVINSSLNFFWNFSKDVFRNFFNYFSRKPFLEIPPWTFFVVFPWIALENCPGNLFKIFPWVPPKIALE